MRLDIAPVENPRYNCLDVLMLTVTLHLGIEHRLMFANGWRFRYQKAPAATQAISFEKALDVRELVEKRDIEGSLGKYHGLLLEHNTVTNPDQGIALVGNQLTLGMPVALGVDAYCCHWSGAHRKYHLEHYCLAIGLVKEKRCFLVIDPYLTMQTIEFPFAAWAETMGDALVFRRASAPPEAPNWQALVRDRTSAMLGKFREICDLADDLETYLDFGQEVTRHEDPFASRLVLYFKTLAFSRLNYAECLAYLGEVSGENSLIQAAARMKEIGNEIFKIFLLLMKAALTPHRFKVGNITHRLREIANHEEALASRLMQAIEDNSSAKQLTVAQEAL